MIVFNPNTVKSQQFSLPGNIIYYITKNPISSILYRKLLKTCKYFFAKDKIVVARHLTKSDSGTFWSWNVLLDHKSNFSDKSNYKLWITYSFINFNQNIPYSTSKLLTNIKICNIKWLTLFNQIITFKEYLFLTSSKKITDAKLSRVTVKNDKNEIVYLEILLEQLPLLETFSYIVCHKNFNSSISSTTAKNLLKLPAFANLQNFELVNVPKRFKCAAFDEFKKRYKKGQVGLHFTSK